MTRITRLQLTDFRNHAALDMTCDAAAVCLYGANGAGKTNLLEAISQLGPGRGLRSAALAEMTREGAAGGWTVAGRLDGRRIGAGLETGGGPARRVVRIDGAPASASDLAELVRLVWLTPAMDRVFAGPASDRRRFFDRQVMAHIPAHGTASARYDKAMRERNALLERGAFDPAWADAIEGRMAEAAAQIVACRSEVLAALQAAVDARPDDAFPKADLALDGAWEQAAAGGADAASLQAEMMETWRRMRRVDAEAGRTLKGPHRSDLATIHRPTGMPAKSASTGQQKALLTGLVLASASALARREGAAAPLILLDEAAAHLDADRRAALYDALAALPGQAWLTGTDRGLFEAFGGRAMRFRVEDGVVADG